MFHALFKLAGMALQGAFALIQLSVWFHAMTRLKVGDLVRPLATSENAGRMAIIIELPHWTSEHVYITYTDGKSAPRLKALKANLELVSASR